jgi:hypothetical protein
MHFEAKHDIAALLRRCVMKQSVLILLPLLASCAMSSNPAYLEAQTAAYNAELGKALAGKSAGKPQSCIRLRDSRSTQRIGDRTIMYEVSRRLTYRNDPLGGCSGLSSHTTLVTRTWNDELCRGDIVTPVDLGTGSQSGSCMLGDFIPYRQN